MPTTIDTLGSELSSAEICRRNGWGAGVVLRWVYPGLAELRIEITAVGHALVLAKQVFPSPDPEDVDAVWDLRCREWQRVKERGVTERQPSTLSREAE